MDGAKPLHILHALNFYDFYLTKFFSDRPYLAMAPYDVQLQELVNDGFATAHLTASHLEPHGFKSTIVMANCQSMQLQWAEKHGLDLYPFEFQKQVLKAQIEYYKPDILYLNDPLAYSSEFIFTLDYRPKLIMAWRAGPIPNGTNWYGIDVILSNISGIRAMATELGARHSVFHAPGIPNNLINKVAQTKPTADIVFAGQVGWGHIKRGEYINFLAKKALEPHSPFTCNLHISGDPAYLSPEATALNKGSLFGMDYFRSLRSGEICIDVRGDSVGIIDPTANKTIDLAKGEGGSMRLFEGTGCGAFMMCEDFENLDMYFERDKEIVVFRDQEELLEKIAYYKSRPSERFEIAVRGHSRCMRDHSMDIHTKRFVDIIKQFYPTEEKTYNRAWLENTVNEAVQLVNSDEPLKALEKISEVITVNYTIPDAHYIRGICFLKLKKVLEAANAFEAELKLSPQRADVQELLHTIRSGLGLT